MFNNDWKQPDLKIFKVITDYCRIRNKRIVLNGKEVIQSREATLIEFLDSTYRALQIDYPKFHKMDNQSKAGLLASEFLFKQSGQRHLWSDEKINIVLSNSYGSLDTDVRFATSAQVVASPALFVYTLSNIVAGEICIRHKVKGENAFFVAREFDPHLLVSYVSLLKEDQLCIAGWVNVMGEHHDVFLYLLDRSTNGLTHTATVLTELYNQDHGTING